MSHNPYATAARFAALYAAAGPELRHLLDERAAIHEFDGRAPRAEAEGLAAGDYHRARAARWGNVGRKS